jgi:hypothetical protein
MNTEIRKLQYLNDLIAQTLEVLALRTAMLTQTPWAFGTQQVPFTGYGASQFGAQQVPFGYGLGAGVFGQQPFAPVPYAGFPGVSPYGVPMFVPPHAVSPFLHQSPHTGAGIGQRGIDQGIGSPQTLQGVAPWINSGLNQSRMMGSSIPVV